MTSVFAAKSFRTVRPDIRHSLVALLSCFALLIGIQLAASLPAAAGPYEDALNGFTTDDFSDTADAIGAVAATGDPRAAALLEALQDSRLMFSAQDKKVFIKDKSDKLTDAATGAAVDSPPADIDNVRLNNRVRGLLDAAIGSLTLMAKDPARRLEAARAVFKSRAVAALPALENAIAAEQDGDVKQAMLAARAAILIGKSDAAPEDRIAAVRVIRDRGDQDALALLNSLPADAPPELKTAADAAISSIQRQLELLSAIQNVWYGLSLGSVLLLAAIGLAITFGVMGVINMAHGEMVMLGAYTTFVVQEFFRAYAPGAFDLSLMVAVPAAFIVAGSVGIAIERGIIRFLYGRPLETLLATWGVSLILQQAVRTIFGASNREVGAPSYMSGGFDFLGLAITYNRLWIIVFTFVVFAALLFILKATPLGLQMRAVTQNRRMAASMGIRTGYVDAMTFALGSGIAGIAGVALSQIDNVSPNLGQGYIIDSFLVVVFGGVGNLWGTFVSAFALGITNKILEPWAGAVLGKILILVLLILFIQKRPRGLFALKGRAVEA
ncbi:MAG: urea ABC transporter permease subunit UrtB [Rhodomicrobiaceae bacterium]